MFATLLTSTLVTFFAVASVRAQSTLTIDTPSLTQCQNAQATWAAGTPPYEILVVPNADPCNGLVTDLGTHNGSTITWKVAIPAGEQVIMFVQDATGTEAWSGTITVASSTDSSCLPASNSTSNSLPPSLNPGSSTYFARPPGASASVAGAANAGSNPTSGAPSVRQFSGAAFAITALAVVAAIIL